MKNLFLLSVLLFTFSVKAQIRKPLDNLYIAEAGKFGAGSSRYDEQGLSDPFYNNYFIDMRNWFHDNDVSRALKL